MLKKMLYVVVGLAFGFIFTSAFFIPELRAQWGGINLNEKTMQPPLPANYGKLVGGYPGSYAKGKPIRGFGDAAKLPNAKVFHAGTARAGDQIVTNGGRVLGVTAWAKDLRSAQAAAYAAVEKIHFDGAQFRRDIAAKAL